LELEKKEEEIRTYKKKLENIHKKKESVFNEKFGLMWPPNGVCPVDMENKDFNGIELLPAQSQREVG
jgi:hypothetical protein